MVKHFDHITVVVRDVDHAKAFFTLLGFEEDKTIVISGPTFEHYMGVSGIAAEHVTLVLPNATPRCEVQLLRYHHPDPSRDPGVERLDTKKKKGPPKRPQLSCSSCVPVLHRY